MMTQPTGTKRYDEKAYLTAVNERYDTAYLTAINTGWTDVTLADVERAWADLTPTQQGERIAEAKRRCDRSREQSASAEKAYEDLFFSDEYVEATVLADAWALKADSWAEYLRLSDYATMLREFAHWYIRKRRSGGGEWM